MTERRRCPVGRCVGNALAQSKRRDEIAVVTPITGICCEAQNITDACGGIKNVCRIMVSLSSEVFKVNLT